MWIFLRRYMGYLTRVLGAKRLGSNRCFLWLAYAEVLFADYRDDYYVLFLFNIAIGIVNIVNYDLFIVFIKFWFFLGFSPVNFFYTLYIQVTCHVYLPYFFVYYGHRLDAWNLVRTGLKICQPLLEGYVCLVVEELWIKNNMGRPKGFDYFKERNPVMHIQGWWFVSNCWKDIIAWWWHSHVWKI